MQLKTGLLQQGGETSFIVPANVLHCAIEAAEEPGHGRNVEQQCATRLQHRVKSSQQAQVVGDVFQHIDQNGAIEWAKGVRQRFQHSASGLNVASIRKAAPQPRVEILRRLDQEQFIDPIGISGGNVADARANLNHPPAQVLSKVLENPAVVIGYVGENIEVSTLVEGWMDIGCLHKAG